MEAEHYSEDPITVYQCGACMEDHETKAAAKKCCGVWCCGWCGEEFDTKKQANACCKDEE